MLTVAEVQMLLSNNSNHSVKVDRKPKWFDGYEWHTSAVPTAFVGKFEGKAGTSRKYIGNTSIVAYQA